MWVLGGYGMLPLSSKCLVGKKKTEQGDADQVRIGRQQSFFNSLKRVRIDNFKVTRKRKKAIIYFSLFRVPMVLIYHGIRIIRMRQGWVFSYCLILCNRQYYVFIIISYHRINFTDDSLTTIFNSRLNYLMFLQLRFFLFHLDMHHVHVFLQL